jgi:hypothetical protein
MGVYVDTDEQCALCGGIGAGRSLGVDLAANEGTQRCKEKADSAQFHEFTSIQTRFWNATKM